VASAWTARLGSKKLLMDARIGKCASCCECVTKLPAASHFLTSLLLFVPFTFSVALIAYSESQKANFPPLYTSWRNGIASASLITCVLAWAALHKKAPGSLRILAWCNSVLGHWGFVVATVDAQFARDVCHKSGWSAPFCSTSTGDTQAAAASLATAAALDAVCLIFLIYTGGVLQQRAARLNAEAEQAEAARAVAENATLTGTKRITISVS
jgi:hypothetical protein